MIGILSMPYYKDNRRDGGDKARSHIEPLLASGY
jgi:hypothetical protein